MNKNLFKGKKKLSFYILILAVFLVGITLGSSLLSSTLKIIGASEVRKNSWIIYFDDIDIALDSAPNSNSNDNARIAKNGVADPTKQNIEFTASLKEPGDFYEFTVWTINDGSIDAEVESLEKSVLTVEQQKYLEFDVMYDDGTPIEVCDILYHKGSSDGPNKRLVKAIVKFKKGIAIDDYPKDGVNLDLYFKINYRQKFACEPTVVETKNRLTIRPNGGVFEGRKAQTRIYLKETENYLLSRPTRELYNFDGWNAIDPETGGTYELTPSDDKYLFTMGSEDVVIEAKWKEGNYVARIMDHYYTKVEDAFDAVDGVDPSTGRPWQNNTVWLIKDTDEVAVNNARSSFTFDLGGHTLTGKIVNPSTGKLTLVNGVIQGSQDVEEEEKQRRIDEEKTPAPFINGITGEGVLNYGTLTMGKDDGTVEVDNSISIVGSQYGIYNVSNSKFKFYDGYIQSRDAFSGLTVNYSTGDMNVATDHFTFIDHRQENEKDYQKVYLTPSPNRAVVKTTTVIQAYYYNLQDAINSVLDLKQQNTSLTDNDYIIEAIRTFEAAYDIEIQLNNSNGEDITTNENNARIFFDLKGYSIQTGKPITNNGYFKIYNSKENNSVIQVSKSIVNNKSLVMDNIKVLSSTADDAIINKDKLKLTDVIVNSHEGYSVKNIENGTLDFNENVVLKSVSQTESGRSDQYALYNSGVNATLNNGTIYGLYNTGTITVTGSGTEYIPTWNDYDRYGNKVYLKAIYNSGNIIMNDGIVSTNLNTTLIDNDGTFTFNGGVINSDYLVVDNSGTFNVKGSEVVSSSTAITGGVVNVDGGNVRTTTTDAITWATVNVKSGEVIAEEGVAIGDHSAANIQGGTVTGTTYGVYGDYSSLNISSGLLSAPIAANTSSATVTGGKVIGSEYAIIASSTTVDGGEVTSPKNAITTTTLNMTGGKVDSDNEVGITINGTGTITGGEVYGGTYGVLSKDTLTLGSDDGTISSESPLLEGELLGLYIEGNTTNFYDGILKGQGDGYEGSITGTPLGGVVGEGSEDREENVVYNTDFISSFAGWLRIGDTPYNTLNEASSAIADGQSGTIIVTRDADIKFLQQVIDENHNKNITLDLNGHVVTTTQKIINNSNFTIIDSSTSSIQNEDVGSTEGTLKILKNDGIENEYKLVIDGGRYESITNYVIVNNTYQLENETNNVIQGTVINKGTFNVANSVVLNGLTRQAHLRINGINVETSKNTFINSSGDIEINGTKNRETGVHTTVINATNNIVNNETNVVINGGKLFAVNSIATGDYGSVVVNEKKKTNLDDENQVASTELSTTESHALYSYWGNLEVNGGTIETRDTTAVTGHHAITVTGGTIKGTRGIKNEMWCTWSMCGYEPITVTGGTMIGTQYEGAYLTGGYGYFKGGLFIGQTDGIYNSGTSILGTKGENLSITSPEARGVNGYGFNNNGYMNFYDGILKGKKKDGISNSSHNGMIQRIEDATQVKRDYEYINNVYYETEYLETQGDWLEIEGKGTYNTVDKACRAASNGDTIKVIADTHIAFEQYCEPNKNLTFDENGHSVSFTQAITFDSNIVFKDSVGNGLLHDENHNMIITNGTSKVESGNYRASGGNESIAFINRGTSTITGGSFSSINSSAIYNQGTLEYNDSSNKASVVSDTTYGITNTGTLNFKNGNIKTHGGIYNNATFTMDNGTIEGTDEYSIYGHAGMATINGGQIVNDVKESIVLSCSGDLTVNDGTITSTITNAIHASGGGNGCDDSRLYVNGGTITGKTNGIVNGSSAVYMEINGGHIVGQNNNGVNISNCNTNIDGGIIEGGVYGVYSNQDYESYITQLGDNDSNVSIDAPVLKGELFGLYINKGTLNFYDGVLKGQNEGFIGQITNIADRTELYYEDDEIIDEVEYQVVYLLAEKVIARNIDKPHGDLSYTEYTNLQDAFNGASNGDTIELVDNAPIYYPVTNNKDVTLDMKGYVISTNKMITNTGELEIKNTNTTRESEIKTSASLNLINSTGNIKLENIVLRNTSSSLYVLQTSGEAELKNVRISSILGINSSNKLTITNSTISTSNTAINNTGILSINGGSYSGNQYSIYSNTTDNVTIKNTNLSGIFYNSGNNISRLENSTLTGELQNRTSNLTVLESTLNRDVSNTGTVLIDTSHVRDSITNSGTMTILDSDVVGASGDVINNSGTMTIKNSSTNLIGIYYYYYTTYTGITNTGTLNIDNSVIEQDTRENHATETHAINNSGILNISNKSKVVIGMDTRQSTTLMGIYSSGNGKANIVDSNILVKNANNGYGVYLDSTNSEIIFNTTRTYPEETELLALQDELAELTGEQHGLSETNEQIIQTVKIGKIEVINSNNSYGAYINKGTFELGNYDGSGDENANVSIFKPLVKAIGTARGIAIKKIDGLFNFYDGRVVGSRYAKPETTSKVEHNYEVTTYVDFDTGYEYAYLEYMKEDYEYSNAMASITRGIGTTLYYPSVKSAIEAYLIGINDGLYDGTEEILLLQSTVEGIPTGDDELEDPITIPSNANIRINLNGRSITTKFVNNGTLSIYNGSVQNFDKPAIINKGTLYMGQNDEIVSSTNIRVISEVEAVRNEGTFVMYDGYLEGNPSIQGDIDQIAPFSRIYTVKDQQSEKKYLQSLDEQSIRNGETALFVTINPLSGYYDGHKGSQVINKFFGDVVKLKDPRKGGCTFLGWDLEGETTLVPIESGTEDYENGYRYKFTVGLTDVTLTAKWEVSESAVAKIGEEYFDSVADAIMAASEGDKIEIIKDVEEDVSNNKNVTIDLANHKITGEFINTGILRLLNGTIENPNGIGIWNKKTLLVGENDTDVSMDSVRIIGTNIGIQNDGGLRFYDGYIEGEVALNGDVDQVPQGYFLYIEHNSEKDCQREYLIGSPENAVAITKNSGGEESTVQYFFSLQDAIDTATISGKEIFIVKDFTATYAVEIKENSSIVINLDNHDVQFGNTFTNNGTLKMYDTYTPDDPTKEAEKGTITTGRAIVNNGTLTIEDISISQSRDNITIENNSGATLNLKDTSINALNANAIKSDGTLNLIGDNNITSNTYALVNNGNELTISSGVITGIISSKDLTINNGATISTTSSSVAAIVPRAKLTVNGGRIISTNCHGIYNDTSDVDVVVNGGTITGKHGLYCNSKAKYTFNAGTIETTDVGVQMVASNCDFEMNGGKIETPSYALNVESNSHNIDIKGGELKSTGTRSVRLAVSSPGGCVYTQTGGTVIGSEHGLYATRSYVNILGGEVRTTSTSGAHYAIYNDITDEMIIGGDAFINAPSTSGLRTWTPLTIKDSAHIYAGGPNAIGIEFGASTELKIQDNALIETSSPNSIGVHFIDGGYSPTLTMTGGTILSEGIGIHTSTNTTSKTVNILGGTVSGQTYGIYHTNKNTTVTIGSEDSELSTTTPLITGGNYAIYKTDGVERFYSGRLKGYTYGYNGTINSVRVGKEITKIIEPIAGTEKELTYSTLDISREPISKNAKIGNGHARITYIDEDSGTCIKDTATNFIYSGEEDEYIVTCPGKYLLEVWGASGGGEDPNHATRGSKAGAGGYSAGEITLNAGERLYINVGGQGAYGSGSNTYGGPKGGYNGGGDGGNYISGAGGGATHIATSSGLLSTLENNKTSVLIVAGGGGGSDDTDGSAMHSGNDGSGGSGGGASGAPAQIDGSNVSRGKYEARPSSNGGCGDGGSQTKGYAFGKGESVNYNTDTGGAGAGWYGGYVTNHNNGGAGGGSGYIGNTRLSNAAMYGYNVEATKSNWIINYLVDKDNYLQVDEEKFNTINDAVDYIVKYKEGKGTILLLGDVETQEDATFKAGTDIVFNLQGFSITKTKQFINKGKLKVMNGTITDLADNVIQNENDLTVDNSTFTSHSSYTGLYVPEGISTETKLYVKDSTINGGAYGILASSKEDITVENSEIKGSDTALYLNSNYSTLDFKSGTITSTGKGLIVSSYSTTHITSGTINSSSTGIYGRCAHASITIDDMNITSTSDSAIGFDVYSTDYNTLIINSGTYKGANYGIVSQTTHLTLKNATVETTSTNRDRYALLIYHYADSEVKNTIFKSSDASGVYVDDATVNFDGISITATKDNAYGMRVQGGTVTLSNSSIDTTGLNSIGIYMYNGTSTMNNGSIDSNHTGIYMENSAKTYVYGGTINARLYGIRERSETNVLTIGKSTEELTTVSPVIKGIQYGIYKENGVSYFYNGKLGGSYYGFSNEFNGIREKMEIAELVTFDEIIENYTLSTKNVSSIPTSKYAKAGDGFARFTYLGETTETCENNKVYNIPYSGEEYIFTTPCSGEYKIEIWGAAGGYESETRRGGYGGYATGKISLVANEKLYVNVGGAGTAESGIGGYNGGGSGGSSGGSGGGGGATHVATTSGLLSTLENDKSSVIIVAGGGGGYAVYGCSTSIGGSGGGHYGAPLEYGGTQEKGGPSSGQTGGKFGKGGYQSNSYHSTPGAGAGWYGGGTDSALCGAGGGSGYIGNTRLSDAYMYGYEVEPTDILWVYNYLKNKKVFLQVDEEKFNSFNDAVDYIVEYKEGKGTIKLIEDATMQEDGTVVAGADIVFDLQGNTLTATSPIINKGKLKVTNGTFNNVADNAIRNEGDLSLEDIDISAGSTSSVVYVPSNLSTKANLNIKDATLSGGRYALFNESAEDITIDNVDIESSDTAIYINAQNTTLEFISGNIVSTEGMGISLTHNTNIHITSGTINSKTNGIYGRCYNSYVTIDTMDITSTNNSAIAFDTYNTDYNTINISGGTYQGADYGIVSDSTHLHIKDSKVITTSTNRDRYAIHGYYASYLYIDNCIIESPSASGIYIQTDAIITNTSISAGASNGFGIFTEGGTTIINDGSSITTTGTSSSGIYTRYNSPVVKILDADISSQNIGIYLEQAGTLTISNGKILGHVYGINQVSNSTVNIGEATQDSSIYHPFIEGSLYGIYKTNGTTNFYSGRLKGLTGPYYGVFNNIKDGYEIHEEADGVEVELQNVRTFSTSTVSSTPIENSAKKGNGYAKITYNRLEYVKSKYSYDDTDNINKTVFDYSYIGDYQIFKAPVTGDYKVELWGAQGGDYQNNTEAGNGHHGGYTSGTIHLEQGTKLYVYVGQGLSCRNCSSFNATRTSTGSGNPGGGATDVRLIAGEWDSLAGLRSRIMVAGGGGSSEGGDFGGAAGGLIGYLSTRNSYVNTGGSQVGPGIGQENPTGCATGAFGKGSSCGATGGGGYYGGGGASHVYGSGSGGSSFISGHKGAVAVTSIGSTTPRLDSNNVQCTAESAKNDITCSYHYSGYKFTDTVMIDGLGYEWNTDVTANKVGNPTVANASTKEFGHTGDGHARISLIENENSNYRVQFINEQGSNTTKQYSKNSTLGTLEDAITSRSDIEFEGWYLEPTYENKVTSSYVVNKNFNLYAKYVYNTSAQSGLVPTSYTSDDILHTNTVSVETDISYTGGEQTYVAPVSGYYKLEVWGASGGIFKTDVIGGYGGYSKGNIYLNEGDTLYINVGGKGIDQAEDFRLYTSPGGYNGGGNGGKGSGGYPEQSGGSGGGATHIALKSGLLKSFDTNGDNIASQEEIEDLLIVAGGGGGASYANGGSGGGASGVASTKIGLNNYEYPVSDGGSQTTGYSFGLGQSGRDSDNSWWAAGGTGGGGGGFFGGYTYQYVGQFTSGGGGGGSGYIANELLNNKAMYCYKCTVSDAESTKTISVNDVSDEAESEKAKRGNGHARITLVSSSSSVNLYLMHDNGTLSNDTISYQTGASIGTLPTPSYDESVMTFKGWYYEPTYLNQVQSTDQLLSDTRVFAKFTYANTDCDYDDGRVFTFDYLGHEEVFMATCPGEYKLETWGAQGADYSETNYGGYGSYSVGKIELTKNEKLYINVGGQGVEYVGGYNGGGNAASQNTQTAYAGGGATHIALKSGLLSSLENSKDKILIVSGGGGGAGYGDATIGGSAGGYVGNSGYDSVNRSYTSYNGTGATQDSPGYANSCGKNYSGSFGQGGNYCNSSYGGAGGGGGYYGGGGSNRGHGSGGGGTGYIGNSRLYDKSMYGYNVSTKNDGLHATIAYLVLTTDFVKNKNQPEPNNKYKNLQEAIDRASSGDTLELMSDASLSYEVVSDVNITLDLNGFNLSTTKPITNSKTLNIVNNHPTKKSIITNLLSSQFITNSTNATLSLDNVIVKGNSLIKNSSSSTLLLNNTELRASATALENTGTMTITNSIMEGTTYAVYDNSQSTASTIGNSKLLASNTGLYANGTGKVELTDTDITGTINVNNANSTIKISKDSNSKVDIKGRIENKGQLEIKDTDISYTYHDYQTMNLINNSGLLTLKNNEIELNSGYVYNADTEDRILYSTGTVSSTGNYYLSKRVDTSQTKVFKGIYNEGILTSTNDSFEGKYGKRYFGIYNNSTHDSTITNVNVKSQHVGEYDYGIASYDSINTITGANIELSNNNESKGIYVSNTAVVKLKNVAVDLHDNTNSMGLYVNSGELTLEDGTINSSGTTAYGVYMVSGVYTQGIYDGRGTDSANVSITDPEISAIGTTKGVGVRIGNGDFNYYDGHISGSTSAFEAGDIVASTEHRYHVEYSNDNKSCILKFNM